MSWHLATVVQARYGFWTVIAEAPRRYGHSRYLLCQCECGTRREVALASLHSGQSFSCNARCGRAFKRWRAERLNRPPCSCSARQRKVPHSPLCPLFGNEHDVALISPIDWNTQPLGLISDNALARQLGVAVMTVSRHRQRRHIPAHRRRSPSMADAAE